MKTKLISFDVWNTLLSPNPEYAKQRNQWLSDKFNIPISRIEYVYNNVKNQLDNLVEKKHQCLSNKDVYSKFLRSIGIFDYNRIKLRDELEHMFEEYPPIYLSETIKYLHDIQEQGIKLSIASNTNFIRGKTLNKAVISKWGINWKFGVFSDQINHPKPHPQFWKSVTNRAYLTMGILPEEIIHIGDNKLCDGSCIQSGIHYQYNESPSTLLTTLENLKV